MNELPEVFVVEDHPVTRVGTAAILSGLFNVCGMADSVGPAVEMILERNPDLVLLDVKLPGGGGARVIKEARSRGATVPFLAFTVLTRREDVIRMFEAGVDGYIVKTSEAEEVIDAIRTVLAGGRPVSKEVAGYLLGIDEAVIEGSGIERLTPREREVTELIARGDTYRECAARLGMSVKTLENHMDHIFRKLEVQSRHELTAWAFERGFVQPDGAEDEGHEA